MRTRYAGDAAALEPAAFLDEHVGPLLDANSVEAGRAARRLGLVPLTLDVDGSPLTLLPDDSGLVVRPGAGDELVVRLSRQAFSDLMQDVSSTFALQRSRSATIEKGRVEDFVEWEPVLRCLLDGRGVYEPRTIDFRNADGAPLDLMRSFTLDDDREEIGTFLAQAGFLHIAGVFTAAEMAAVSAELDDAIKTAERGDGASWWARTEPGGWYPARILGFNQKSPALRELLHSSRFAVIGTFTGDRFDQRDPDVGDSAEGLLKKAGVVEGPSDVSWHKDCTMGGHSRRCCDLVVGIQLTDSGGRLGELSVVAGSNRANVATVGVDGLDLPRLAIPARAGDLTVHCSCTLHMSRPPATAQRRVVYTGFNLAPRQGDQVAERTHAEIRRERAALGDDKAMERGRANKGSSRMASLEL